MSWPTTLDELLSAYTNSILLECVAGSHAYGLNRPGSDVDRRGIFALPANAYAGLVAPPAQLSDARSDVTFFALRRFAELAASANPNMLELLFTPAEFQLCVAPQGRVLLANRGLFLSRAAFQSHVAYATAQIKRARGQNKWVNRPQPEAVPRQEDFCWLLPIASASAPVPFRPVRFAEASVRLEECHAAAVEHATGLYRLYDYGAEARGVFRGGNLVLESIPLADEGARCVGLMIFNRQAYESAKRDHANYWEWRRERNPARWEQQEAGELDYDAKNMMHTFRLLMAAEGLLRDGELRVRFDGPDRDFLMAVRGGMYDYDFLIAEAERRTADLEKLLPDSPLPAEPDLGAIDALVRRITTDWERERA